MGKFWRGTLRCLRTHTKTNVLEYPGSIGIDTGCVYGGHLTAYIFDDRSLVQVRAHRAYAKSKRLPNPI